MLSSCLTVSSLLYLTNVSSQKLARAGDLRYDWFSNFISQGTRIRQVERCSFLQNEDIILGISEGALAWTEKPIVPTKTYFITQKQTTSEQGELPTVAARRAQKTDSVWLTTKLIMCRMVRSHRRFLSSTCGGISVSAQKQADGKAGWRECLHFCSQSLRQKFDEEKPIRKPSLSECWYWRKRICFVGWFIKGTRLNERNWYQVLWKGRSGESLLEKGGLWTGAWAAESTGWWQQRETHRVGVKSPLQCPWLLFILTSLLQFSAFWLSMCLSNIYL